MRAAPQRAVLQCASPPAHAHAVPVRAPASAGAAAAFRAAHCLRPRRRRNCTPPGTQLTAAMRQQGARASEMYACTGCPCSLIQRCRSFAPRLPPFTAGRGARGPGACSARGLQCGKEARQAVIMRVI
jgi:hypothetical protein